MKSWTPLLRCPGTMSTAMNRTNSAMNRTNSTASKGNTGVQKASIVDNAPPAFLPTFFVLYLELLSARPLLTKALTASILSVVSDLLVQVLTGTFFNANSIWQEALIGLVIRGAIAHYWTEFLSDLFKNYDQKAFLTAMGKMAIDQAVYGPISNWAYFYVNGFLNGKSLQQISATVADRYVPVMMANYKVWPLFQLISFRFIPTHLQVLFGNIIGIFWTAYVILQGKSDATSVVNPEAPVVKPE